MNKWDVDNRSLAGDPITGWVVCVRGSNRGRDYRILTGFNRFGSSGEMDIILTEEPEAAACSHCSIVYDDRGNKTYLVPGDKTKTSLNGNLLEKPEILENGDEIRIGDTAYVYVAFCNDGRSWKEL